jgi:hypothetical protein
MKKVMVNPASTPVPGPSYPPPSLAEFEALCGRPNAFAKALETMLRTALNNYHRCAHGWWIVDEPQYQRIWWIWPWNPNIVDERGPWWRCHADDIWAYANRSPHRFDRLIIALPVEPEAPEYLLAILQPWLREVLERPQLELELHGPRELFGRQQWRPNPLWAMFELDRALASCWQDRSELEHRLVALLDEDPASVEAWSVISDDLLARGTPGGELLAGDLANASDPRSEELRARWEAQFGAWQPTVQTWTSWRGPFLSRLYIKGPASVCARLCARPEARYLSPQRVGVVESGEDLSRRDLSGFDLGSVRLWAQSFIESDLRECSFDHAQILHVAFDGADLRGADFRQVERVGGCRFVEAIVSPDAATLLQEIGHECVFDRLVVAD